ncbi:hypothetical protein [Klebsiella oxytoca]|uniref:hypothetical protein n=1 Tax=Klebsiella oxytoca TaxID=571 RepID=UPI002072DC19
MISTNYEFSQNISNTHVSMRTNEYSEIMNGASSESLIFNHEPTSAVLCRVLEVNNNTETSLQSKYFTHLLKSGSNFLIDDENDSTYLPSFPGMLNALYGNEASSSSSLISKKVKIDQKIKLTLDVTANLEKLFSERLASRYLMKGIERSFKERDINFINDLLLNIGSYDISDRSKAIVLRVTFRARERLPAWSKVIDEVEKDLINKGTDPDEWLIGLI